MEFTSKQIFKEKELKIILSYQFISLEESVEGSWVEFVKLISKYQKLTKQINYSLFLIKLDFQFLKRSIWFSNFFSLSKIDFKEKKALKRTYGDYIQTKIWRKKLNFEKKCFILNYIVEDQFLNQKNIQYF